LSLERPTRTLSGGEVQRIGLATQVGSSLIGVLYVLDEPSIGLHPRDHQRLLEILKELRDRGNTVLLVEHDEETIRNADYIVDIGPRAGRLGGEVMATGTLKDITQNKNSLTGQYLSGKVAVKTPSARRKGSGEKLILSGASGNNLKGVTLEVPLGTLCGVTGVSGSGKSTLIIDTLYRVLAKALNKSPVEPAKHTGIKGIEHIDRIIQINQKPIGRTPRSTPSTYVGLFTLVRDLFANLPDAKIRGHKPGQFSFNVKGGRCEACEGAGMKRVEMHFLSDVYVTCDVCHGQRYNAETRSIKYRDKSIADVLSMTVAEALDFFKNHKIIHRKLETLHRVGLDYITLGQSSTTLSGGEAQRIKLSKELSKRGTGRTMYILDEPTTGLHFEDIRKLIELLQELAEQGNTVLVIEHNLDVVKCCDWVIDLGPDGGNKGGEIVAAGTPEVIAKNKRSITGPFLAETLSSSSRAL
jgi:excinuclease ABC subunit A